jgi:hypothetical protein
MTFNDFVNQAFVGFLIGTFALAGWFCRAVVVELREMKESISEMNITLAVVTNNQVHQSQEIDIMKNRLDRLEKQGV